MRATITTMTLVIVALGVGLACDEAPSTPPPPSIQHLAGGDLIALLPSSTVAAVELHDIASRWDELHAIPRLGRLQDRILEHLELTADDVPEIAGERAVLAFIADEATHEIVTVAVFDPASREDALARLGRSGVLAAVEERGALWAGPAARARLVERVAAGDGTSLRQAVDFAAVNERLPGGGLVRAVIYPGALRDHLRVRAEIEGAKIAGKFASFFRADLEAVEAFGFRRDVVDGEIVTDGWIGIDAEVVPEAFTTALTTPYPPATLPTDLPSDVLVVKSFRIEAEASLAWLRTMAARDPDGPYRNFDFWVNEFEARTGVNVERDIVDALGGRGLALVLVGDEDRGIDLVAIFDARDPERLEASLVELRDWLGEQVWGRSLGLAIPRSRESGSETGERSGVVHGIEFRSPFGTLTGPVFQLFGDRLILATSRRGLDLGVELAASADSWSTPAWAFGEAGPPDEIALMRTGALSRVLAAESIYSTVDDLWFLGAISEFLDGAGDGQLAVFWEARGFRIAGRLRVDG